MVNFLGRTDSKETHERPVAAERRHYRSQPVGPRHSSGRRSRRPQEHRRMQAAGVKELEIYFIQSLQRAQKELSRWGGACESAWNKLLIEQGMGTGKPHAKHAVAKHAAAKKPAKKAKKKKR